MQYDKPINTQMKQVSHLDAVASGLRENKALKGIAVFFGAAKLCAEPLVAERERWRPVLIAADMAAIACDWLGRAKKRVFARRHV